MDTAQVAQNAIGSKTARHGTAFIVESMLLLVFLVTSLVVAVKVLGLAYERAGEAEVLSNAVALATSEMEDFVSEPVLEANDAYFWKSDSGLESIAAHSRMPSSGVYRVVRNVHATEVGGGVLYEAEVLVSYDGEEAYSLESSTFAPYERIDASEADANE